MLTIIIFTICNGVLPVLSGWDKLAPAILYACNLSIWPRLAALQKDKILITISKLNIMNYVFKNWIYFNTFSARVYFDIHKPLLAQDSLIETSWNFMFPKH